jgi:hypothetical protein
MDGFAGISRPTIVSQDAIIHFFFAAFGRRPAFGGNGFRLAAPCGAGMGRLAGMAALGA